MKTLVLPSGKTLAYEVVGSTCTESELSISFKSNNTPNQIDDIFKDTKDLQNFIEGIDVSKKDYSVYATLTKDNVKDTYTVVTQKESIISKMESLELQNKELDSMVAGLTDLMVSML